jgi:hypothetical protein
MSEGRKDRFPRYQSRKESNARRCAHTLRRTATDTASAVHSDPRPEQNIRFQRINFELTINWTLAIRLAANSRELAEQLESRQTGPMK